ncbi:hypothetical protein B4072_1251 [Bacillus subtilis]|nr:hypothetical protein B4069_1235 [Bacillus subtilis]KIN45697.1 hypothetical protein B4072_1251 [Bacillus subtilis]
MQANSGRQLVQPLSTVSTNQAKNQKKVKTNNNNFKGIEVKDTGEGD